MWHYSKSGVVGHYANNAASINKQLFFIEKRKKITLHLEVSHWTLAHYSNKTAASQSLGPTMWPHASKASAL
ncbi:hypothetical protein Hanom_Chr09g00845351 [Helianthus anomalus]